MRTDPVGSAAPGFDLQLLGGGRQTLGGMLAGGPAVLAFFKVSCPVCQLALPYLERMAAGAGLQFVAISQDSETGTRKFHDRFGIAMPTLLDPEENGYAASNAYGVQTVPTLYVVEADGIVSRVIEGFSKRELEALGRRAGIAAFQAGENVPEWKAG